MIKNNYKSLMIIFCLLLITVSSKSFSKDFPPDNPAVLYLRAFILYEEPDSDLSKMLDDLRDDIIKPNEQIREYFKRNQQVIELVTTASQIHYCNWGRDNSKGPDLMMPELALVRKLAFMLVADSKIFLYDGDYKTSLEICMTIHRMAHHASDDLIISNLVGVAINGLANKQIKKVLSEMPPDIETLEWLKSQMLDISANTPSFISSIVNESQILIREIRKEKINEILGNPEKEDVLKSLSKGQVNKIRNGDDAFFEQSRKYYLDFIASVQTAFGLPYEESYKGLNKLSENVIKDFETNPVAFVNIVMPSSVAKLRDNEAISKTNMNAVNAAIDIYIQKAKTGKLPDELPEGLPKDMFSGKDFKYEKTDDGFIFRCQGKDLERDKFSEYEFKVKK